MIRALKLCFYNCMENMERFTPLYAIAYAIAYAITYAITNSMENLRFDKEDYFHVSTGLNVSSV